MAKKRSTPKYTTNLKRKVKDGKASVTEVMATSAVGTQVYEIQDPSERLVAIIGAAMFNEPKYYPTDPQSHTREYEYDESDFDAQAQLIINTATQIARSDNPRDLLAIAHWARKEMKIRTTPQVLLTVAAHCPETKEFVREYCRKVISRADELKQVFIASRSLYGSEKSLPNSLKRGLADTFRKFKEIDFLKYEGQHRPFFSDVLKMVDRATDYPLPKALDTYLKTGEVTDEKAIPVIAARKKLTKLTTFGPEAVEYANMSRANWEILLSQFGNTKEIWEHLIDSNTLPYMATLRNLRNMLQADISKKHINKVCKKLVDGAIDSKQLPFRFLAAKAILEGGMVGRSTRSFSVSGVDSNKLEALKEALDLAVERVLEAMDSIPGKTLVAIDNSGSMGHPVSENSSMSRNEAAAILGAMMVKKSEKGSILGGFGSSWKRVPNRAYDQPALELARTVQGLDVGHATNAEAVIEDVLGKKEKVDRIILISDMQTYGGGSWGYRSGRNIQDLIKRYRHQVKRDCKLHCIDVAGYGRSLTEQADTNTNLVAGFSEKLMDTILEFEGLKVRVDKKTGEEKQVFTMEYIRENF